MKIWIGALVAFLSVAPFGYAVDLVPVDEAKVVDNQVAAAAIDALEWLKLVDAGKYEESWEIGSRTLQLIMKQKEWVKYLEKVRKPLGSVTNRSLVEQRTAKDPAGVPKGNYMVMLYDTAFATEPKAKELMILSQANDGSWRTMSYFIKEKN